MPEITAIPILAAPPPAAAQLAAIPGKPGAEAAAARPKASTAPDDRDPGQADAPDGDSFAAVLGRHLAKDASDAKPLPTLPVVAPTDVGLGPVAQDEGKSDDRPPASEDGSAAGIATLLPLLQSLLPGASPPRPDAKPEARGAAKALDAGDAKRELAGLQAGAPDEAAAGPGGRPARAEPPQALLGTSQTGSPAKEAAAIPAAEVKAQARDRKPAEVPEASFANALASAQAPAPVHIGRTALTVASPVGSSHWDRDVGEKLVWMTNHQEQRADLTLNPPQMGKVEVSISVQGDQANAQFVSANPAVRDALEAALPRLREMLADAGINLGQAQVGSDSAQNASGNPANNRENGDNPRRGSGEAAPAATLAGAPWLRAGAGMVDVFA